jgi:pyruvate formate lyase activating enzyme
MKEAMFYEKLTENRVKCLLCNHHCVIKPNGRGICGVRENQGGTLYSLVYGRLVSANLDPIEKKPLFHFLPGTTSFSIATVGCNFQCAHCQNWQISQFPHLFPQKEMPGDTFSPEEVVQNALAAGASSISYTYVEPTIFYEFAYDCAVLARQKGLKNVFVSNGYMSEAVTRHIAPVLDAINIDIKGFTEGFYHEICKARLQPVLENVKLFHELGVWVEVTTLIIPGKNDSPSELEAIAQFIAGISPNMPWHVSAFYPAYKMLDTPSTKASTLVQAREIGLKNGLNFVYVGNILNEEGETTRCPHCKTVLIRRMGYKIIQNLIQDGECPQCKTPVPGVYLAPLQTLRK